ncbi:ParB/RepB/Spo0J family partition protein [Spirochaetota bacterium]
MATKYGLGKGLGALIPDSSAMDKDAKPGSSILLVPSDSIKANIDQPRKHFDEASIAELAESIKRHGIIQPLVVELDGPDSYRIIAGERRWRAAKAAGLAELPVIVKEYGHDKRLEIALVENVQREDLNPVDEAEAYRQLMEASALTQEEVAERVGKSRPAIANSLRLLSLSAEAKEALRSGSISAGHARAILSALNPADRKVILQRVMAEGISVRETEAMAASYNTGARLTNKKRAAEKKPGTSLDPELSAIEQNLIEQLGTKVAIRGNAGKGSIVIDYYSMDDLDRLYGLLCRNT